MSVFDRKVGAVIAHLGAGCYRGFHINHLRAWLAPLGKELAEKVFDAIPPDEMDLLRRGGWVNPDYEEIGRWFEVALAS